MRARFEDYRNGTLRLVLSSRERLDQVRSALERDGGLDVRAGGDNRFGPDRGEFPVYLLVRARDGSEGGPAVRRILTELGFEVPAVVPRAMRSFRLEPPEEILLLRQVLEEGAAARAEIAEVRFALEDVPEPESSPDLEGVLERWLRDRLEPQLVHHAHRIDAAIAEMRPRDGAEPEAEREARHDAALAERDARLRALSDGLAEAKGFYDEADAKARALEAELRAAAAARHEAEERAARLTAELTALRESPPETREWAVSTTLPEAVERLALRHRGKVLVLPSAVRTAGATSSLPPRFDERLGRRVDAIMDAVGETLGEIAWNGRDEEIADEFKRRTGLELAMRERGSTRSNKRLMRLRQFEDAAGTVYLCEPHVKESFESGEFRMYLHLDRARRLIRIGHVGDHLETAGTARQG